jgi:hypothetical protein
MRAEIAERCRPAQVRLAMNNLGLEWIPLPARPTVMPATEPNVRLANQTMPRQTSP